MSRNNYDPIEQKQFKIRKICKNILATDPTAKAAGQNFFMQLENIRISTKIIVNNCYWPATLVVGYKNSGLKS